MIAKHVIVSGRVQGVWFRAKTKERADALGVKGWVRNRPGGGVEAVLEGQEAAVIELVNWLGVGPTLARVDRMEEKDVVLTGFTQFEIKH